MSKFFTLTTLILLLNSGVALADSTITFDDINIPAPTFAVISNGYAEFNWTNFYVEFADDISLSDSGYPHSAISHPNVAFNGYGNDSSFASLTPFSFNSAYLTSAWLDNNLLTVTGYLNGIQTQQTTLNLMTSGPIFAEFNWDNIDQVTFHTSYWTTGRGQFAIDNMTVASVPEADTYAMLLSGLGVMGFIARRKNG